MLSKGIATSFNSPIVTMPGSGFAQTFIGMDVIIVMFLIRKARKLAAKWGGQCMIFIDEIDAVGMRRRALGGGMGMGLEPTESPFELAAAVRLVGRAQPLGRPDPREPRVARSRCSPRAPRRPPTPTPPSSRACAIASTASCSPAWAAWAAAWR